MNCLRCNTPNEDEANFCKNCGKDLNSIMPNHRPSYKLSDIFLIFFFSIAFVSTILETIILIFFFNWYWNNVSAKYVMASLVILQNLSYILIPFSIRNKTAKIIGFIITSILIIIWIYRNINIYKLF